MRSLAVIIFAAFAVASFGMHSCREQEVRARVARECTCAGGERQ